MRLDLPTLARRALARSSRGLVLLVVPLQVGLVATAAGCARDREAEGPAGVQGQGMPPPGVAPIQPAQQPPPVQQPPQRPISIMPRPAAPAQSAATPAPISSADLADLYRAQDACLSNCDQFACMRIASAYRDGLGVPRDPLAGRRYAIHACLECGAPGVATEGQCPGFGVTPPAAPPKKK